MLLLPRPGFKTSIGIPIWFEILAARIIVIDDASMHKLDVIKQKLTNEKHL